ncbi:MAG: histidine phosphatase family protein [Cyclobacteriaceae bacterium]
MVRKIFLLRHGEAALPEYGIKDFERPLTARGENKIRALGDQLKNEGTRFDSVFCSSSKRTKETYECLCESMQTNWYVEYKDEIYEAPVRALFEVLVNTEDEISNLLLIGHNPGISFLSEYLSDEAIIGMSPGQLVKLEFGFGSWSELSKGVCSVIN